jgi:hypothetical protein
MGKPPLPTFVQLEEARAEWRRRHPPCWTKIECTQGITTILCCLRHNVRGKFLAAVPRPQTFIGKAGQAITQKYSLWL